jgi:hypothetical protein
VRIARADLDAFLDAGSSSRNAGDLEPLRQPLAAALAAVNRDDRSALAQALERLADAAHELAARL